MAACRRRRYDDGPEKDAGRKDHRHMTSQVPSLYEWVGGLPALDRLTRRFYERVREDPTLAPIFAEMSVEHPKHVSAFIAEVFGGPADYSAARGGHAHMIQRHLNR